MKDGQHRRRLPPSQQGGQGAVHKYSRGSVEECRYFLILAKELGYADTRTLSAALEEVSRLLNAYSTATLTSSTSDS